MRRRRRKGLTLIEVLGAILILAGVMVGTIICSADGLAASRNIEATVKASLLAQTHMESMKAILVQDPELIWGWTQKDLGDGYLAWTECWDIPGRHNLREILVFAGYDKNGNGNFDSDEETIWLRTILCSSVMSN